jgi:adenylate kinase
MTAIILLGPPGAGKGTVAETLAERGYTHVSTGDLLREQIRLETPLGTEAKARMDQGRFVPDDVVVGMIRGLLESAEKDQKFLFDGFPRTLVQAERFDELLLSLEGAIAEVILLECPDETIVERLSGRRTCGKCGTVYHLKYNPSPVPGICEADGCELIQRPDDNAETIKKRLEVYAERTAPLVAYYQSKGLIHPINATQSIADVRNAVLEELG